MNIKMVVKILGRLFLIMAIFLAVPLIFCLIYQEEFKNYLAFIIPAIFCVALGLPFSLLKVKDSHVHAKEGFFIVGFSWLALSLVGAVPFVISGMIPSYIDAFFEIASGFTTTGASILTDIEALVPTFHSLFFFRSFSHFLGGMGILVFILTIIPEAKEGSVIHILRAESPGPTTGRLVSKLKASSQILYLMYIALTVFEIILLWCGDMDLYAAIIHGMGTAGTGGFSIMNASVGVYSQYSQYVIGCFMIIFGINFSIFFLIISGRIRDAFRSEEFFLYLSMIILSIAGLTFGLNSIYHGLKESFRISFFQVASLISTTGYSTTDFNLWPTFAKMIVIILMLSGACAGSTAGGMKVSRVLILLKSIGLKIRNLIKPNNVKVLMIDKKPVEGNVIRGVEGFVLVYLIVLLASTFIVSFDKVTGNDLITSFTASLACLSNIGPGLGLVGPNGNFAGFNGFTKVFLSLVMITGRLEIFPIILLFYPKTYLK